jgi:hypothetical protein
MPKLGRIRPIQILDDKLNGFLHLSFANGKRVAIARLGKHYDARMDAAPPPTSVDYHTKARAALAQTYLNDRESDCVIAGKDHLVGVFTGNDSGTPVIASDMEVQNDYVTFCGPHDQGCIITQVLDLMKSTGMLLNRQRHTINDYVAVDHTNQNLVQVAIDLFGGLTLGISLPKSWEQAWDAHGQTDGFLWEIPPNGDVNVGGHDVSLVGYNDQGVMVSTWGTVGTMTWDALASTVQLPRDTDPSVADLVIEECYALLSPDWTENGNLAPNGVDAATLAADLALIQNGQVPPLGPPGPPQPPVNPPTPVSSTLTKGFYRLASGCTATVHGDIVDVQGP